MQRLSLLSMEEVALCREALGIGEFQIDTRDVKETLIPLWAALTGRRRRAITAQRTQWGWIGIDRSLKLLEENCHRDDAIEQKSIIRL
jgi:hypothetical protein